MRIFFTGFDSPDLHIQRVEFRVARGGHDIPEAKIREGWVNSIYNLMQLTPMVKALSVFDNSQPADRKGPHPICLFSISDSTLNIPPVEAIPDWAKPFAIKRCLP